MAHGLLRPAVILFIRLTHLFFPPLPPMNEGFAHSHFSLTIYSKQTAAAKRTNYKTQSASSLVWFSSDYYVCIFRVYWLQPEYFTSVSHLCSTSSLLWGFSFLQNLFLSLIGCPHDALLASWHADGEVLYFAEVTCSCSEVLPGRTTNLGSLLNKHCLTKFHLWTNGSQKES